MLHEDPAELRKARGAFFTPPAVARFIADWAVRSPADAVLEPSCGEAVFLHEAGREGRHQGPLVGVEVHEASAAASERSLRAEGIAATIHSGDFFDHEPDGSYNAVIGNPPYVRYQGFSGEARARARRAALRAGVSLTGLASSWAAFTVHSALFLRRGGRLGLVLPAELLTVNYAADVRRFLMQHFSRVRLVLFVERVFPGVLEEVVLVLAEDFNADGTTGTDHCDVYQVQNPAALLDSSEPTKWVPSTPSAKWTASMVPAQALTTYAELTSSPSFGVLQEWGETSLGMVTGNNKYFCMSPKRAAELGLSASELVPLSPPGSRHLRQLSFTRTAHNALGQTGSSTLLFRPARTPSRAAQTYIRAGEKTGVQEAYKCRVRSPWWRVPDVAPADLLLTYMNSLTPQLSTNRVGVRHLNSVHGVYLKQDVGRLGSDFLPLAALNSVTLLGAETVGRAYGGGMLKMEPREADQWPMPSTELVLLCRSDLASLRPRVKGLLNAGRLLEASELVDDVLLRPLNVSAVEVEAIRKARAELAARRSARGRDATGG
jgi:adenine-specific DNA-methyltransferase